MNWNKRFSPRGNTPTEKPARITTLEKIDLKVPLTTGARLRELSAARKVPINHMVNFAIDNEFDCPTPFNYPVELPTEVDDDGFIDEASRILRYLKSIYPTGLTLPMLTFARNDMKIESKATFLSAMRVLLNKEMIEEFEHTRAVFEYPEGTKHYRWIDHEGGQRHKLTRKAKLEAELAALNKEINGENE